MNAEQVILNWYANQNAPFPFPDSDVSETRKSGTYTCPEDGRKKYFYIQTETSLDAGGQVGHQIVKLPTPVVHISDMEDV